MNSLAEEIIAGRRLGSREEALPLVEAELEALCRGADRIRSALCGSRADLCTIVNGRSGQCGEDCKFCAQSCHYRTQAEEYPFLAEDEILAACRRDEAAGARRFSIVTAGRSLKGEDLERALSAYRRLRRETGVELCASHGLQTQEEFERMKAAGVDRIHANLETSRRYFPHICTTHTYQDKVDNIRRAQAAGLDVCSGERMNGAGEWEEDTAPGRSAVCWPGEGGPTHRLTVNGAGEVTGVRIEVERTGEEVLFGSTTQQSLAAAAFAAAQPGWNGVSWWSSGVLQAVGSRPFDSYTLQAGAVTVTQMVSWEGYQDVGGWLLAEDGVPEEELYCRTEFTMTLQT